MTSQEIRFILKQCDESIHTYNEFAIEFNSKVNISINRKFLIPDLQHCRKDDLQRFNNLVTKVFLHLGYENNCLIYDPQVVKRQGKSPSKALGINFFGVNLYRNVINNARGEHKDVAENFLSTITIVRMCNFAYREIPWNFRPATLNKLLSFAGFFGGLGQFQRLSMENQTPDLHSMIVEAIKSTLELELSALNG